jgi:hypothetical protein
MVTVGFTSHTSRYVVIDNHSSAVVQVAVPDSELCESVFGVSLIRGSPKQRGSLLRG